MFNPHERQASRWRKREILDFDFAFFRMTYDKRLARTTAGDWAQPNNASQSCALPQGQRSQAEESKSSSFRQSPSVNGKASLDTLIIPQSLRENLQAYCRILRDLSTRKQ
jgi:hypothetical protein